VRPIAETARAAVRPPPTVPGLRIVGTREHHPGRRPPDAYCAPSVNGPGR
jgi:hypothetical protein